MYAKDTHAHTRTVVITSNTPYPRVCAYSCTRACTYTCVHTVLIAKWSLFEGVESAFSLKEQLVGCVGLLSHATFAMLYRAIVERTTFWQNGWIVSANENEFCKVKHIFVDDEDQFWLWQWPSAASSEKLPNHWCSDFCAKPLCDQPMKLWGTIFVVFQH